MSGEKNRLKWYTAVRVDVVDMRPDAGLPMQLPDPDVFMDEAERKRFFEYHGVVLQALAKTPITKDLTSLFKDDIKSVDAFHELAAKVCSLTFDVEDVEGKFFGTIVFELQDRLSGLDEMILKEYCRCLCDEMLGDGTIHSPFARLHGDMSIRIWRDRSHFLLTEQQMERAPWRKPKPKQKGKGGGAR